MAGNESSAIQVKDAAPKSTDTNLISFPADGLSTGGPPSIETLNSSIRDNLSSFAIVDGQEVIAGNAAIAPTSNMSTFSAAGYQTYGLPGTPQQLRGAPEDFAYPRVPVTPITPFAGTGYVMPTDAVAPAVQFTGSQNGDVTASPQTSTVASPSDISANASNPTPADTSDSDTSVSDTDAQTDNTVTPTPNGGCGGGSSGGGSCRGGGMGGLAGLARLGLGIGLLSTLFRGGGLGMGGMFGGLMGMSMLGRMFGGGMGGMGMGGMGMGGMNPFAMFGFLNMFRSRL